MRGGDVERVRSVQGHSSASRRQLERAYGRVCSLCLCGAHVRLCPGIQVGGTCVTHIICG